MFALKPTTQPQNGFEEGYKEKKQTEMLLLITSTLVVSLESTCINIYLYFQ